MSVLIEKPAFPGASTNKVFPRFLLLGIGAVTAERPSRLGRPVATVSPYEDEIADFDQPPWPESEGDVWTEAKNQRRCDLIDRKHLGNLTPVEARELARLQAQLLRHRQRVAPLPLDDARRLYKELLAGGSASLAPTDP